MRKEFLSFAPPCLGPEEIEEVASTLRGDWITTGPKARRFEEEFARFVGAPAALAVSSGTDAMLVGLAALGVGPGDEVVTSTMTWCSTAHVIEHLGARPVLVDVEPETLCIDVGLAREAVTARTKGVMPVHLYGNPCDMDSLSAIAERNALFILEDAAHALPTRYKGRMVGGATFISRGQRSEVGGQQEPAGVSRQDAKTQREAPNSPSADYADSGAVPSIRNSKFEIRNLVSFSFYATKNLTTGEGGMLTGDPDLIDRARVWSLHGMSRDAYKRYSSEGAWFFDVVVPGFKCNMTDIMASIGLQQLKKLPGFQKRRREIVGQYSRAFAQMPEIQIPTERTDAESAWHLYVIRLHLETLRIDRKRFIEELRARNIGTGVHFIPVHLLAYYRDKYGFKPDDFPVAHREYQRIISLPLSPRMTDQDVTDVIEAVGDVVEKFRR